MGKSNYGIGEYKEIIQNVHYIIVNSIAKSIIKSSALAFTDMGRERVML